MAGKLSKYRYETDGGKEYTIRMDASNAKAVGNIEGNGKDGAMPVGLTPRVIHCELYDTGTKRLHKRQIVICKPGPSSFVKGTLSTIKLPFYQETGQGQGDFRVTGYTGEKRTFYS